MVGLLITFGHPNDPVDACGGACCAQGCKKAPFWTYFKSLLAASWAHLGGCWAILAEVFGNMLAGIFWGANLRAK